jgi:hypothetical protein
MATKDDLRHIVAAAFAILLLAEWCSHGLIFSHHADFGDKEVSATKHGHEDPCGTLIICNDGKSKNQQLPGVGHDISHHNAFFERSPDPQRKFDVLTDPLSRSSIVRPIVRPPDPAFHPPEI